MEPSDEFLTVKEFCDRFGLSTPQVYKELKRGAFLSIRVGKKILIRSDSFGVGEGEDDKHTAGPWEYNNWERKGPQIRAKRHAPEDGGYREAVAICKLQRQTFGAHHDVEANARIIVKAPEMFAALEALDSPSAEVQAILAEVRNDT